MNNFFLLNEAIDLDDYDTFIEGMSELVAIDKEQVDVFLKHESLWNIPIINQLYANFGGFAEQAIYKYIEQLQPTTTYISNEKVFDELFPNLDNAFLGINFSSINISKERQIIDEAKYKEFCKAVLWQVTYRNLWSKREKLFPNLILCGEVREQIEMIGNSGHFNQIIERLKELNSAIANWTQGSFNYNHINQTTSLRISPESDQTMRKFGSERVFSLPNGGTETFELHIKTGDLRFHFLPDNVNRKVFIGYIGSHLNTISN